MKKLIGILSIAIICIAFSCKKENKDNNNNKNNSSDSLVYEFEEFMVNGVNFKMMKVNGGSFQMGAAFDDTLANKNEKPQHNVTLSDYYIGETEVTQALYKAVMGKNISYFKGDNLPIEAISWENCQEFIIKLNELTGKNFRLPTEAEWEYAAKGGQKSKGYIYSGSNTIDEVAWYDENSFDLGENHPDYGTHAVKQMKANELGIYDMSGNVHEWCNDWFGEYEDKNVENPQGPSIGTSRVVRGGSWNFHAKDCRVSLRDYYSFVYKNYNVGFRLAL